MDTTLRVLNIIGTIAFAANLYLYWIEYRRTQKRISLLIERIENLETLVHELIDTEN